MSAYKDFNNLPWLFVFIMRNLPHLIATVICNHKFLFFFLTFAKATHVFTMNQTMTLPEELGVFLLPLPVCLLRLTRPFMSYSVWNWRPENMFLCLCRHHNLRRKIFCLQNFCIYKTFIAWSWARSNTWRPHSHWQISAIACMRDIQHRSVIRPFA